MEAQTAEMKEKDLEQCIEDALLAGGYEKRANDTYDKVHALDPSMLLEFLRETQKAVCNKLRLHEAAAWQRFLDRLSSELKRRGVIDVLRSGICHDQCNNIRLYYALPDDDNETAKARHAQNRFGVIRQLAYSQPHVQDPGILDMGLYINGIPVVTIELKNEYTRQNVQDAVRQYQNDRDPKEPLLVPGRCAVHFAVDTREVAMCSMLRGKASRFLPFNRGKEDGSAGNPVNPAGFASAYLWEEVLQKESLCDIIEHYACRLTEKKKKDGKQNNVDIFPRYHQMDAVRRLLADVRDKGAGVRYLIQHSAGSGKSNTITWLALQLTNTRCRGGVHAFDAVVVVTDRRNLDKQLSGNIRRFCAMKGTILHADKGTELAEALADGSAARIIISTIQKFPVVLRQMQEMPSKRFAIIIDEAHSSQGGSNTAALNRVLGLAGQAETEEAEEDEELLDVLARRNAELRRLVPHAGYFAFTATPKVKTLRMFGQRTAEGAFRPFHHYSMKQAIQEGFILDVLAHYTPIRSYFRLRAKAGEDAAEEYDAKKAQGRLKKLAESNPAAIREKASIMVEHFLKHGSRQIAGQARAMVVCDGIVRAIDYFRAIEAELKRQGSSFRAIIAFSGEKEVNGEKWDEARLNGFPSSEIEGKIQEDPYRILVVADKFQTGYDEPLMQTMYVDKKLSGVKTVQTLSRLNRARADKTKTFVLDFYNDEDSIRADFEPYYKTTVLSGDCDANRLHDLKAVLDEAGVYREDEAARAVLCYLTDPAGIGKVDTVMQVCCARFSELEQDEQIRFKSEARCFLRYYDFLSSVLPYTNAEWEKLSCFLRLLLRKLPSIERGEDDRITAAVELESYRAEVGRTIRISPVDEDGEMKPPAPIPGGGMPEPEMRPLSDILSQFHDLFGNIQWKDEDNVRSILERLSPAMAKNIRVADAMANSDEENIRLTLKREVDNYLNDYILKGSNRLEDIVKLLAFYNNKDSDFAARLLDLLLYRLRTTPYSAAPVLTAAEHE